MIPLEQGGCCLARYNASNPVLPSKKDHILSRYRPIAPRPIAPRPIAPKPDSTAASPPPADLQSSSSMSVGSRAPGSSDVTTVRGRRPRKRLADKLPAARASSSNKRGCAAKVDASAAFMERAAASTPVFPDTHSPANKLVHVYSGGFSAMLQGIAGGGTAAAQHQHQQQQPLDPTTSASLNSGVTAGLGGLSHSLSSPPFMALDLNASAASMAAACGPGALDLNRAVQGGGALDYSLPSQDMRSRSMELERSMFRSVQRPPLGLPHVAAERDTSGAASELESRCGRPQLVTLSLLPDTPSLVRAGASDAASSACTSVGLSLGSDAGIYRQDAAADTGAAPCRESAVYASGRCLEDRFELLRSRQLERDSLVNGGHHHPHAEGHTVGAKPLLDTFRELVSRASITGSKPGCELSPPLHHRACGDREDPGQHPKVIDLSYLEQVYGGSSDPLMLTDESQVVMWCNPAFKRASFERNSRQGHAMSPYIDPLGVPTRLISCLFQAAPTAKCRAVLWGFLKKFVTQEPGPAGASGGGGGGAAAAACASCTSPGCNRSGGVSGMSCSPHSSGQLAEEKRLQERNFFGIGLPHVDQARHNDCLQHSFHKVIAPQPLRPVGTLGNSTTLTRLLAAVKPAE